MQLKGGLAAPQYPVKLVGAILKSFREDLRRREELSGVAAFAARTSPHKDYLAEGIFVDNVHGGVLDPEK